MVSLVYVDVITNCLYKEKAQTQSWWERCWVRL